MKTGVFGGTFNPVHYGHLRVAEEALESLGLDRIVFVPAGNPPLKEKGLAPYDVRMQMVEAAISTNDQFEVSDIESQSEGKSYTVDTLKSLARQRPGDSLVFILGLDAFLDIHLWRETEELLGAADFAVVGRPGWAFSSMLDFQYAAISHVDMERLDNGWTDRIDVELQGGRLLHIMRTVPLPVSATMIRELAANGRSMRYLLPESVESFIISHGLYSRP